MKVRCNRWFFCQNDDCEHYFEHVPKKYSLPTDDDEYCDEMFETCSNGFKQTKCVEVVREGQKIEGIWVSAKNLESYLVMRDDIENKSTDSLNGILYCKNDKTGKNVYYRDRKDFLQRFFKKEEK